MAAEERRAALASASSESNGIGVRPALHLVVLGHVDAGGPI